MKFLKKPWVSTTLILLILWVAINIIATTISFAISFAYQPMVGDVEFWPSFWNMMIGEAIIIGGVGIIIAALVWLVKGIRKGLKEEKTRYKDKL